MLWSQGLIQDQGPRPEPPQTNFYPYLVSGTNMKKKSYELTKSWNKIPLSIRNIQSPGLFKKAVVKHLAKGSAAATCVGGLTPVRPLQCVSCFVLLRGVCWKVYVLTCCKIFLIEQDKFENVFLEQQM